MKQPIGKVYEDKHGHLIASIHLNGKQHLKRVKTREQAQEWFLCLQTQSTQAAQLTFQQLNDAANALTMLRNAGASDMTLTNAITEWLAGKTRSQLKQSGIPLHQAIAEYLDRSKSRVGPGTLHDYGLMLRHFEEDLGHDTLVDSLKRKDAMQYLDKFLLKPPTWRAYQRTLSKFYSECVKMEWCAVNPFANMDKPMQKPPSRTFLSVQDTETALRSIEKRAPRLIHFLTLGLFAGIRPIESLRLTASHVNLATGYIHLDAGITKSHSYKERVVPINETLKAWFTAYPFKEKPVPVSDICYVDKVLKESAEKDHWSRTHDNLRHSFCTYQFALTNNSAETAAICGHAEAIAMKHYRGRVTKDEAIKYFDILPGVC